MTVKIRTIPLLILLAGVALLALLALRAEARDTPADARVIIAEAMPKLDGAALLATVVEVTYPPGGSSRPHTHPCPVIGVVLDGEYRSHVMGGPDTVYHAGDTFYEPPNGEHRVSANAGDQPVRFLAYFLCDKPTPLSKELP